ncbi:MAG: hypothetical protein EB100_07040 [Crocinitomicaceae bacterium]|nr:hypothetical protein [Crocinitomicaceae bacterium]
MFGLQTVLVGTTDPEIVLFVVKTQVAPGVIDSAVEQASPVAANETKDRIRKMNVTSEFNQLYFMICNY